jgi:plastocyanin
MDEQPTAQSGRGRRFWLIVSLSVAGVILLLCVGVSVAGYSIAERSGEPGSPVSGVTQVAIEDNHFSPDSIEIPPGTTVTWTWKGDHDHNVHGDGLDSPTQDSGTYAFTFDQPGTYDYECTLHLGMKGRVIVSKESR